MDEVLTEKGLLKVQKDLESLVLVKIDLASGQISSSEQSELQAGSEIEVELESPTTMVVVGCYVDGQPFEGYTSFIRKQSLKLTLETPESILPGEELELVIECHGTTGSVPVLISVRDERLSVTDTPEPALASALKRGIEDWTGGMDDEQGFIDIAELSRMVRYRMQPASAVFEDVAYMDGGAEDLEMMAPSGAFGPPAGGLAESLDETYDFDEEQARPQSRIKDARESQPERTTFPELLFYGLVPIEGQDKVNISLGDSLCTLAVEVFTLSGGDWSSAKTSVCVDKPLRVDLDLPPAIHVDDTIEACLRATSTTGAVSVQLTRNGEPVSLRRHDGTAVQDNERFAGSVRLVFDATAGDYQARVQHVETGATDQLEVYVAEPGRFRTQLKRLSLLEAGQELTLEADDALALHVLPGLDEPFGQLLETTAGYTHLCCEQTAAKIIAAAVMYLSYEKIVTRKKAEDIILAGVARERRMFSPGKGFTMYPDSSGRDDYYGPMTVRYLWSLRQLNKVTEPGTALHSAIQEGLSMADDAARVYGLEEYPSSIDGPQAAYAVATQTSAPRRNEVRAFWRDKLDLDASKPALRGRVDAVSGRAMFAYAAASVLAIGDLAQGLKLANVITRQLNKDGGLYSTVDSVAAVVLMIELQRTGVAGPGRVRINGREMATSEAAELNESIETIEVIEGVALAVGDHIHDEDWDSLAQDVAFELNLKNQDAEVVDTVREGERLTLSLKLSAGYSAGDLAFFSLPACLSWIHGGGRVKKFSLDFAGADELEVPLVVTGRFEGKQHYAVCVRNMFVEERAAAMTELSVSAD